LAGGADAIEKVLLPELKTMTTTALDWKEVVSELGRNQARLCPPGTQESATPRIAHAITSLVEVVISKTPLSLSPGSLATNDDDHDPDTGNLARRAPPVVKDAMRLLEMCQDCGCPQFYLPILESLLGAPILKTFSSSMRPFVIQILTPFLVALLKFMQRYKIQPSTPPFSMAISTILCAYADYVVGPREQDASQLLGLYKKWPGNHCGDCNKVTKFLTSGVGASKTFTYEVKSKADHIQARLNKHTQTIRCTMVEKGVTVEKLLPTVVYHSQWSYYCDELSEMLRRVGSSKQDIQRTVLGSHRFNLVQALINGKKVVVGVPSLHDIPTIEPGEIVAESSAAANSLKRKQDENDPEGRGGNRKKKRKHANNGPGQSSTANGQRKGHPGPHH